VAKDEDIFFRIDFTNQDGTISTAPLRFKERMQKVRVPLWVKTVEVYRLDSSIHPCTYFYDDTAIRLSQGYGIELPHDRGQITWKKMLDWESKLLEFIKWPS
jgi:hypothetical protein